MRIDGALLCAAVLLAAWPAVGAPLEPEACATLKSEHGDLVAGGAKSDMDRGPDWAKANLSPERLGKIERLIAVEEQLSFRCGNLLTARPALKELPKPQAPVLASGKATPSNIPLPIRKDAGAANAAKKQATKD